MSVVPVDELRHDSAALLQRVSTGEELTLTDDGDPVAALIPLGRRRLTAEELVSRFKDLPPIDLDKLRRDMDDILDPTL